MAGSSAFSSWDKLWLVIGGCDCLLTACGKLHGRISLILGIVSERDMEVPEHGAVYQAWVIAQALKILCVMAIMVLREV